MNKKITMQAIAKQVNMSRNTVSKALNNDPSVTEKTRKIVISAAKAMGYKGFLPDSSNQTIKEDISHKHILVLTHRFSESSPFWPLVWNGVEQKVRESGHSFAISMIGKDDIENLQLPTIFNNQKFDGIICSEIFDKAYIKLLIDIGIPLISIDGYYDPDTPNATFDYVLMENSTSISKLVNHLLVLGHTKIGFVGNYTHCRGFFERYAGFKQAYMFKGLDFDRKFDITADKPDNISDDEWYVKELKNLNSIPTAFVCANDFIAIHVMKAAKKLGLRIPEDLSVTGFDGLKECTIIEPHLTTVETNKEVLGYRAVELLLWRMDNPDYPFEVTHIENFIRFRDSIAGPPNAK